MSTLVRLYYLRCPISNEIRYIGRTKSNLNIRLNGHCSKARKHNNNSHKNNWINSLLKAGLRPKIEQFSTVNGWSNSHIVEKVFIKRHLKQGYNLTNADDRGEGGINKIISKQQRLKISETLKIRYQQGLKVATSKELCIFDLKGNFIQEFETMTAAAKWLGISNKHIQNVIRRNAKRTAKYQIRTTNKSPGVYINPRIKLRPNKTP